MADACQAFECLICPSCCKAVGDQTADKSSRPPERRAAEPYKLGAVTQFADAAIVFVLGKNEDTKKMQIDEYSGLNGYHIRTLPGDRWNNPVLIGAGAGLLAVVDRFTDYDVIRITDKYAGAGVDGFDANGFPSDSVDWASLEDIHQETMPNGTFVTGLKINTKGLMVIHVTDSEGKARYIRADATGADYKPFIGDKRIQDAYSGIGVTVGTPAFITTTTNETQFQFASILSGSEFTAVAVIDALTGKVASLLGLADSPQAMGVAYGNNIMTVGFGDGTTITKIARFVLDHKGGAVAKSRGGTPSPQTYDVGMIPYFQDFAKEEGEEVITKDTLQKYLELASSMNKNADIAGVPPSFSEANLPVFDPPESSNTLNDNLTQVAGSMTPNYYNGKLIPVDLIEVPEELGLQALESGTSAITQLFNRKKDGVVDTTAPVFRMVHASHYDFISEGGFTYGNENDPTAKYSNGVTPQSIASDKDYELGTLKLIDAKAALIENDTGYILYRHPKPQFDPDGLRVYSGDYAALDVLQTNSRLMAEIQALQDDVNRLTGTIMDMNSQGHTASANTFAEEQVAVQEWLSIISSRLSANVTGTGVQISRTVATRGIEQAATKKDGVLRQLISKWLSPWLTPKRIDSEDTGVPTTTTGDGSDEPVKAFTDTDTCADDYWALNIRTPAPPINFTATLIRRSWNRGYTDDEGVEHFLPEWVDNNINPINADGDYIMLVAPRTPEMLDNFPINFNYVGRGGFYPLSVPMVEMTNRERWDEEISALQDLNDDYQRLIDAEKAKPEDQQDTELLKQLEGYLDPDNIWHDGYIDEDNDRIDELQDLITNRKERSFWMIPRSTVNMQFKGVQCSPGQVVPDPDLQPGTDYVLEDMIPTDGAGADEGEIIPVGDYSGLKRGCVIKPGPWAWIAVTLQLRADSMVGIDRWGNPEAHRNGLGFSVGSFGVSGAAILFGVGGGTTWETGYQSFWDIGGAWATWNWRITGVDLDGNDVDLTPADAAMIYLNAPAEAHEILLQDYQTGGIGNNAFEFFKIPKLYMSEVPISAIKVEFGLTHHCVDVFRFGVHTIFFVNGAGGSPICPKGDPGYWAGNNCEGTSCGNVICNDVFNSIHRLHLYRSDPTYPQLDKEMMKGVAVFTCDNPYTANGLAYGTVWKCDVDFNLNNNVRGFDISLDPADSVEPPEQEESP